MKKYIYTYIVVFSFLSISCDNANDLLDQYIKDGPIIYAAKINELNTQSGYYRFKINIFPAEDVNRSYCIISWNITGDTKDSVKIEYNENSYDKELQCYYSVINIPESYNIQGNLAISAWNVDVFGNKSLIETASTYIYGTNYTASLINAPVSFSTEGDMVIFEKRVGAVGSFVSYEQNDGKFSDEVFVTDNNYFIPDAKPGGVLRTKTRFLINETDIDTLDAVEYLETKIPELL